MKDALIWLAFGLVAVGIGFVNIFLAIICVPLLYGAAQGLTDHHP